jgi:hypothetical protein
MFMFLCKKYSSDGVPISVPIWASDGYKTQLLKAPMGYTVSLSDIQRTEEEFVEFGLKDNVQCVNCTHMNEQAGLSLQSSPYEQNFQQLYTIQYHNRISPLWWSYETN